MAMRILILSCGTRYKLIEYFKDRNNGFNKVVATDCSEYAPALYIADSFYVVPRMNEPTYLDKLYQICQNEHIDVILPLQEEELLLIAKERAKFEQIGILVAISGYEQLKLCKDKYELSSYLNDREIPAIKTFLAEDILKEENWTREVFVKPRYGAGSVGAIKVGSRQFLEALVKENDSEQLVVQPYIEGKEYGVDVYVDYISGEIVTVFCKEKLRMRAGETEKSRSVKILQIEKLVSEAVLKLGLKGALDMDIFECQGKYYILEINPRFGGGYPHAYECGINFPKMLAVNAKKEKNCCGEWDYEENVIALKFSDIITVPEM